MPRKTDSGNPYDWLEYAGLDLEAVMLLARQKAVFPVCKSKLAEALEKAMKADLLTRGWALEKIHDLQKLNIGVGFYLTFNVKGFMNRKMLPAGCVLLKKNNACEHEQRNACRGENEDYRI